MMEDDDEGPEIALGRFENPGNDPTASLETVRAAMVDTLLQEQGLAQAMSDQSFSWWKRKRPYDTDKQIKGAWLMSGHASSDRGRANGNWCLVWQ